MQKIIKETIREVKEEVVAVQITAEEFCDIASKECTKMFLEMSSKGEPSVLDISKNILVHSLEAISQNSSAVI